jgi:hypothetical protein
MNRRVGSCQEHKEHTASLTRLALFVFFVSCVVVVWMPASGKAAPHGLVHPWLYLRGGEPLAADEQVVAVFAPIPWGNEYQLRPDPAQRGAARAMLDASANLVIGHHPTLVQGTDLVRVRPPLRHLGFACTGETCYPVDAPKTCGTGLFRAGSVDLTGDGVAELVRLVGQQVVVYQDGVESWRGLPEWRVMDLALGDPNDDGRGELLLALWKPDAQGVLRSHPFIVGFREGAYRILWGGSASVDPIREVELGDVDGDGVQDLIVLEERADGQAVTVWRWHGWGFSLAWRSSPGHFQDLVLLSTMVSQSPVIAVAGLP